MSRSQILSESEDEIFETPASRRYSRARLTQGSPVKRNDVAVAQNSAIKPRLSLSPRKSINLANGDRKQVRNQRALGSIQANPLLLPLSAGQDASTFGAFEAIDLPKHQPLKKPRKSLRKPVEKKADDSMSGDDFKDHIDEEDSISAGLRKYRTSPRKAAKARVSYLIHEDTSDEEDDQQRDGSEDEFQDFIVEDSASESELCQQAKTPTKRVTKKPPKADKAGIKEIEDSDNETNLVKAVGKLSLNLHVHSERKVLSRPSTPGNTLPDPKNKVPDELFEELDATLKFSPSPRKPSRIELSDSKFVTPQSSPSKTRVLSPSKLPSRIPPSPHRPSIDAFWSQEMTNDWIDHHSPQKPIKSRKGMAADVNTNSDFSSSASPKKGSTKSVGVKKTKDQLDQKKAFNASKAHLAQSFLTELDNTITSGQIAALSASTGGVKVTWSKTLNRTAGRANWKRQTDKTRLPDGSFSVEVKHHASVELAEKVIDDEYRLLNTLAHEFCHLANFMVSGIKDQPHGASFKAWAKKVTKAFGDRGVEVTTKHSYQIDFKYVWECGECGTEYRRHSKSVDPKKHKCGKCKGRLAQTKPAPRGKSEKAGEYQKFVKDNYGRVKDSFPENEGKNMGKVMAALAKEYKEIKAAKAGLVKAREEVQQIDLTVEDEGEDDDVHILGEESDEEVATRIDSLELVG